MRDLWRETLASGADHRSLASCVGVLLLVARDPGWYSAFVPESLAGGRDPTRDRRALARDALCARRTRKAPLGVFATFLFTHNAQISMFAFALGFAFCLPSALLIAYNGCIAGGDVRRCSRATGWRFEFGGWVLIHGVTELFAMMLAGAAGFRVGWAVAFPGDR